MNINNVNNNDDPIKTMNIMRGRNNFIMNNNICIIETTSFQDYFMLNNIIKTVFFTENYNIISGVSDIFIDRLSFMDKYKILCKIAKHKNIPNFKKIHDYLMMRNNIAHNLVFVNSLDLETKESEISFGNEIITWSQYKEKLKYWAELSLEMANFILNIYSKIDNDEKDHFISIPYCKLEGNCVFVQHNLIFSEPNKEYTSFFREGFNTDLLTYLNNEIAYCNDK